MAFRKRWTLRPVHWCIWLFIGIITAIIISTVIQFECKKRRLKSTLFASDNLKFTSAASIVCGMIAAIYLCLEMLPGVCLLEHSVSLAFFAAQFIFLGLYQLSRLHYCFGKHSAHHEKGYPKWLFIAMVIIGIAIWLSWVILVTFGQSKPSTCRFTKDLNLEFVYRNSSILFEGNLDEQQNQFYECHHLIFGMLHLWDITTLLLYCCKIKTFRKLSALQRDAVWRKIMFILERIVIITLFYQISLFLVNLSHYLAVKMRESQVSIVLVIPNLTIGCASLMAVLYALSMYLMMDHNSDEYVQFLRCL